MASPLWKTRKSKARENRKSKRCCAAQNDKAVSLGLRLPLRGTFASFDFPAKGKTVTADAPIVWEGPTHLATEPGQKAVCRKEGFPAGRWECGSATQTSRLRLGKTAKTVSGRKTMDKCHTTFPPMLLMGEGSPRPPLQVACRARQHWPRLNHSHPNLHVCVRSHLSVSCIYNVTTGKPK